MKRGRYDEPMDIDEEKMDIDEADTDKMKTEFVSLYGSMPQVKQQTRKKDKVGIKEKDAKNIELNLPYIQESAETAAKYSAMYGAEVIFMFLNTDTSLASLQYFMQNVDVTKPKIFAHLISICCQKIYIFQAVEQWFRNYKQGTELEYFYNQCFFESCFPEGALEIFEYLITLVYPIDRFELAMRICLENNEHTKAMRIKSDSRYNRAWPVLNPYREKFSEMSEQILMS
jgi:hypothetical protein